MLHHLLTTTTATAATRVAIIQTLANTRRFTTAAVVQKSFGALVQEIKSKNQNIHLLTPTELHSILSSSSSSLEPNHRPHIVDVRESSEVQATGTIPGAISIPRGILERDISKHVKLDDHRDVVVYCAGGFRSVLAAEGLVRLGYGVVEEDSGTGLHSFKNGKVWSLEEGMDGWIKEGFKTENK